MRLSALAIAAGTDSCKRTIDPELPKEYCINVTAATGGSVEAKVAGSAVSKAQKARRWEELKRAGANNDVMLALQS